MTVPPTPDGPLYLVSCNFAGIFEVTVVTALCVTEHNLATLVHDQYNTDRTIEL